MSAVVVNRPTVLSSSGQTFNKAAERTSRPRAGFARRLRIETNPNPTRQWPIDESWRLLTRRSLWLLRYFHPCQCLPHRAPETSFVKPGGERPFSDPVHSCEPVI